MEKWTAQINNIYHNGFFMSMKFSDEKKEKEKFEEGYNNMLYLFI